MIQSARISAFVSLLLSGAIFGFFYAWVCSTMWGLDAAHPSVALQAMQAMNASVRNAVFAPAFFGTPFVLVLTAFLSLLAGYRGGALLFLAAGLVYGFGGMVLTMTVNVPMNEALALVSVPADTDAARAVWQDYSQPWQFWNQVRTVFSGAALLLAAAGLFMLGRDPRPA